MQGPRRVATDGGEVSAAGAFGHGTKRLAKFREDSGLMGYAGVLIAKAAPSGGAAAGQTIGATAGALVITAAMLTIVARHRSGRLPQVGRLAAFAERSSGIPGWSSLPIAIVVGALLVAVFGM